MTTQNRKPNYPFYKPEYHDMTNERDRPANERVVAALLKARPAIVRVLEDVCGTTELTADIVAERIDTEILRILDAEDRK